MQGRIRCMQASRICLTMAEAGRSRMEGKAPKGEARGAESAARAVGGAAVAAAPAGGMVAREAGEEAGMGGGKATAAVVALEAEATAEAAICCMGCMHRSVGTCT